MIANHGGSAVGVMVAPYAAELGSESYKRRCKVVMVIRVNSYNITFFIISLTWQNGPLLSRHFSTLL